MSRSSLITRGGLEDDGVRVLGSALVAGVFGAFALAAASTVGLLAPASWWRFLVLAGAAGSTLLLAVFFSPALPLGFLINLGLLWIVVASRWTPAPGPIT